MEKHTTDEKTGIGYTLHGDYYIPDITLPPQEKYPPLGKYGMLRETYLKEHRRGTYTLLQMDGELRSHLRDVDERANEIFEQTVKSLAEREKCDEALKRTDPMKWVGLMNSYRNAAEEIIFRELIYMSEKNNLSHKLSQNLTCTVKDLLGISIFIAYCLTNSCRIQLCHT